MASNAAGGGGATAGSRAGGVPRPGGRAPGLLTGLSSKFLLLTIAFVMVIEMLILVPSVANFRHTWLMGRLDQSEAALGILDRLLGEDMLSQDLLMAFDAEAIVLRDRERTARAERPGSLYKVTATERENALTPWNAIAGAWARLLDTDPLSAIRLVGDPDASGRQVELVVAAAPLREAMLTYMRNIVLISLLIAVVTALLIYAATRAMLIRPVQRLTSSMLAFAAAPGDERNVMVPSRRRDELGQAERELADMQRRLAATLDQQRHLAELGLAVSKINHDMRNILSTAQLVSDRLADVDDPVVKRVAPRLIRALDRAVAYSESVLEYGRATEPVPARSSVALDPLFEEVRDAVIADGRHAIAFHAPRCALRVEADREQLLRVLVNLARNAVQAMLAMPEDRPRRLSLDARREGANVVIAVRDTGPGLPDGAHARLFQEGAPARGRGNGLGLVIARELVEAHGGAIEARPNEPAGLAVLVRLPG